ncbi:hypothetical protein Tco_1562439 [Tanacetum coccineum]
MLVRITFYTLLVKVYAARHKTYLLTGGKLNACKGIILLFAGENVNACRHKPLNYLLVKVNAARHKLTTVGLMLLRFWTAGVVKKINGETQIHALVDGKKVVVTEASIRRDLQQADEGGVDSVLGNWRCEKVNGEAQIHALIDGKKVIMTEETVRKELQLANEERVNCLPNSTIFEELTRMEYEKISQKLTFYKAFFSPQWKFLIHTVLQCLSAKTTKWNEFSSTMASAIICLATNQKFNFSKFIFEDKALNEEMDDNLVRAATTTTSLDAE